MPAEMRQGLEREFHFTAEDIAKVESGQAIAKMAATGKPDDIRMAGVVLIKTTPAEYLKAFRDIEHFARSRDVVQTHRFSSPPVESDLTGLYTPDLKKEILACHPGHCSYKIPADEMLAIQQGVDWNAPDANDRALALVHQRIIKYVNRYREMGDAGLAVYYDSDSPYSVADGLHSLIGSESQLSQFVPELLNYASAYPNGRPPNTEDFLYWQEAAFGLKHVFRTEHVIIQKLTRQPGDPRYAIISKMLFATHYFRAAIEFQYVHPVRTANGETAIFLLSAQRSYVDGMTGVKGAIIRKVAETRSPARLAENLQQAKQELEHH